MTDVQKALDRFDQLKEEMHGRLDKALARLLDETKKLPSKERKLLMEMLIAENFHRAG